MSRGWVKNMESTNITGYYLTKLWNGVKWRDKAGSCWSVIRVSSFKIEGIFVADVWEREPAAVCYRGQQGTCLLAHDSQNANSCGTAPQTWYGHRGNGSPQVLAAIAVLLWLSCLGLSSPCVSKMFPISMQKQNQSSGLLVGATPETLLWPSCSMATLAILQPIAGAATSSLG